MPAGLSRNDEYFGEVEIYYHSADITLTLQRDTQRATLSATSQGCADAGLCYPPNKQYFELDFSSRHRDPGQRHPQTEAATPTRHRHRRRPAAGRCCTCWLLAFMGGAILNLMPCVFPDPVAEGAQLCAQHRSRPTPAQLGLRRRCHCQLRAGRSIAHCAATGRAVPSAGASNCSLRASSSPWPTCLSPWACPCRAWWNWAATL